LEQVLSHRSTLWHIEILALRSWPATNNTASKGQTFAASHGAEYVDTVEELCRHPKVDYVDLCLFPNFRLPVMKLCAKIGKHLLVLKPMVIKDVST
jgi:predicted dehydrogenase